MNSTLIGSAGVGLLLLAFILNLARWIGERSPWYLSMNIAGAALAAWYAWDGGQVPFVVLESAWGAAALVRLVARLNEKRPS
jgi:hypothetical protein